MQTETCKKCHSEKPLNGHRWCGDCIYPGIDEDYAEFTDLIEEGYTRAQAAVMSGWAGAEEI